MGPLQLANHLLGFLAPALFLAVALALFGPLLMRGGAPLNRLVAFGVNLLCGVLVLAGGLWVFGRDGKMATYAALVVVVGSSQWFLARGWRGRR